MDLALSRLSSGDCERTLSGDANFALSDDDGPLLTPDNHSYARLLSQLSAAVAPGLLAPVTTRGPSGFDVAFDTNVTSLDNNASYWRRGTRGSSRDATCAGRNDDVRSALTVSRLRFTKGLPLGLSIGANVGKLQRTSLWVVGAELKLALDRGAHAALGACARGSPRDEPAGGRRHARAHHALERRRGVQGVGCASGAEGRAVRRGRQPVDARALGTGGSDAERGRAGLRRTAPIRCATTNGLGASPGDLRHDARFNELSLMRYRAFIGVWLRYGMLALAAEGVLDLRRAAARRQRSARRGASVSGPSMSRPSLSF